MLNYIVALIKFVEQVKFAEDFLAGNLYCNTWKYFRDLESKNPADMERGDGLEIAAAILNKQIYNPISRVYNQYRIVFEDQDNFFTPVFCLYSEFSKNTTIPNILRLQNKKLRKFGQFGVVIRDVAEFIKLLEVNQPGFSYGAVEYLDFNDPPEENRFAFRNPIIQKDQKDFYHQQEYRIYNKHIAITNALNTVPPSKQIVQPNSNGAAIFNIGDLSNIAKIYSTDELFKGINPHIQIKNWDSILQENISKEFW
jgi:hypothetical protein